MTTIALRLFVTGHTGSATRARAALRALEERLVRERGAGAIVTDVIDVLETPEAAAREEIFATPTIVRFSPGPGLRVFGDLSSVDHLAAALGLVSSGTTPDVTPRTHRHAAPVADPRQTGEDARWPATRIIPDISLLPAAALD